MWLHTPSYGIIVFPPTLRHRQGQTESKISNTYPFRRSSNSVHTNSITSHQFHSSC
ncbi:hypothetical protein SCLCIDRAFT_1224949 [Scleroderma citrinum Foug A]|uniref:Uncharacterized protein n=1 Tax=Scleroderma citrinum Foug A TaxID=1036808 RepID=A0A0C2YMM0_9AGAM|nr:hypothetical protein SCLCIDRAFT_1224949 [Scleroderma citrinum Foug A]